MAKHSGEFVQGLFRVEQETLIKAPRERVFTALTEEIGRWWCHHYDEAKPKITLEAKVGGRFIQWWNAEEGALWGVVSFIKRPETLRLTGPLGMQTPVSSVYQYSLDERDGGASTLLKLSHRVVGEIDKNWPQAHIDGWNELWVTLKAWVEEGREYKGA